MMKITAIKLEGEQIVTTTEGEHKIIFDPSESVQPIKVAPKNGVFSHADLAGVHNLVNQLWGWRVNKNVIVVSTDDYDFGSYMALDTNDKSALVIFVPTDATIEGLRTSKIARISNDGDVWIEAI